MYERERERNVRRDERREGADGKREIERNRIKKKRGNGNKGKEIEELSN